MLILPAIDLLDGRAVRLLHGDYNQVTVYDDNPVRLAESFAEQGAVCLHLVDLDGARSGVPGNADTVARIARVPGLRVEVGGGIRNPETAKRYWDCGAARVILGTAAARDASLLAGLLALRRDGVAVGVDARDGLVAVRGWTETTALNALTFCQSLARLGVRDIIYTDISRDGALSGVNAAACARVAAIPGVRVIASGGVSSAEDLDALAAIPVRAAIVGKAVYEGRLSVRDMVLRYQKEGDAF